MNEICGFMKVLKRVFQLCQNVHSRLHSQDYCFVCEQCLERALIAILHDDVNVHLVFEELNDPSYMLMVNLCEREQLLLHILNRFILN